MQDVDANQVAKFAGIVAATITVLFNVLLYVVKEILENRRKRKSAGHQLILIGYTLWESLYSDVNSVIFSDWYKLIALSESLADSDKALALVVEISRIQAIFREPSANLRGDREARKNELSTLQKKTELLCKKYSISSPWNKLDAS